MQLNACKYLTLNISPQAKTDITTLNFDISKTIGPPLNVSPSKAEILKLTVDVQTKKCDGKQCGRGILVNRVWVCPHNSLFNLYPEIASEWDYERNGNNRPERFRHASGAKVWWKCQKGNCDCHVCPARISDRTKPNSTGCPYCKSNKPCPHNNLATNYPELVKEWVYEKNGSSRPEDFSFASHTLVWWRCKNSTCDCHSYQAYINKRTSGETGCPFCRDRRPCPHNNLLIHYPSVAAEWDYEKNTKRPEEYSYGSSDEVRWHCIKVKMV